MGRERENECECVWGGGIGVHDVDGREAKQVVVERMEEEGGRKQREEANGGLTS